MPPENVLTSMTLMPVKPEEIAPLLVMPPEKPEPATNMPLNPAVIVPVLAMPPAKSSDSIANSIPAALRKSSRC